MRAALAAAERGSRISAQARTQAEALWEEFWSALRAVEVSEDVAEHAGQLAAEHALGGADAVHLASAMAIPVPELIFAVWDRRLHAGAQQAGLQVAPARVAT